MADQAWDPDEHAQGADEAAMQYARSYAQRGMGSVESASSGSPYQASPPRADGRTMRTFIVVAGLVAVAWFWFKSRRS